MKIGKITKRICDLKIGDTITIKTLSQMFFNSFEYKDNKNNSFYLYAFTKDMIELCGRTFEVKNIVLSRDPTDIMINAGTGYSISPSMCQDFSDNDPLMRYT